MTEIIAVETRYVYDSYTDLRRLFDLAKFPSCYVDEIDLSKPVVYIIAPCNGELRPHLDNQAGRQRNAHLILWNIERPSGDGSVGRYGESNRRLMYGLRDDGSPAPGRYVDEVWVSDRRLAEETTLRFVPLGSRPDFAKPGGDKRWDAAHISYAIPRRQTIYKEIENMAPSQLVTNGQVPTCWGDARDEVLRQSRFSLAIHQDCAPYIEPLRMSIFAAYGLPTLCETSFDPHPYGGDTVAFASFDQIVPVLRRMLASDYQFWKEMGLRCRNLMTEEFEFGKVVREAVRQSVGDWR